MTKKELLDKFKKLKEVARFQAELYTKEDTFDGFNKEGAQISYHAKNGELCGYSTLGLLTEEEFYYFYKKLMEIYLNYIATLIEKGD